MLFSSGLFVFLGTIVGLVVNLLNDGLLFLFDEDTVVSGAVGSGSSTSSSLVDGCGLLDGFRLLRFLGLKNGRGLSFPIALIPPVGRLRFGNNSDNLGLNLLLDLPPPPTVGFGLSTTRFGVLKAVVNPASDSDSVVVATSSSVCSSVSTNCV